MSREKDVIFGKGKDEINSLSGPVSFYYLRPKEEVYEDGNGKYFPLIVLFGDEHRSLKGTCDPCVCDTKTCCYKLSDPEFLEKIDTLASFYPVDFYAETFLAGAHGFKGGMMDEFTTGKMMACYTHRWWFIDWVFGIFGKCPTKNIRWQGGDARLSGRYDRRRRNYIEYQLFNIIDYIIKLYTLSIDKNPENIYYLPYLTEGLKESPNNVFTMESLQALLLTLVEGKKINFENFANAFFDLCTKENSLIYKQILKQNYPPFQDPKQWSDFYRRSMEFYIDLSPSSFRKLSKKKLKEAIINLPLFLQSEKDREKLTRHDVLSFRYIQMILHSFLDIYTIARIWKHPDGGLRPSLSFCYFGDLHVENIVNLLQSTNAYELVLEMPIKEKPISRCQTFDFTLNLTEEVRKHNERIH